jgi:peptidoglycan/LPS O-acetylase OafA/YrhL
LGVDLQSSPSQRIPGLDGLRAFAAVTVFFEHSIGFLHGFVGAYGVQLFFVLSGFLIIGGIAERSESRGSRAVELGNFFINRVLRLFPVYFLVLALAAVAVWADATSGVTREELAYHALFVTNFYEGRVLQHWLPVLGHLWSLSVEEQFYLLAAPLFIFLQRRQMERLCLAMVLVAVVRGLALAAGGAAQIAIATDSLVNFGYIAWGGYLATSSGLVGRWLGSLRPSLVLVSFIALPALMIPLTGTVPAQIAVGVLAGALIASVVAHPATRTVEVLETGLMAGMGRISYAFYLFHLILLKTAIVDRLFSPAVDLGVNQGLRTAVVFVVTWLAARLSWAVVEAPAMGLRRRLLMAPRAPASAASAA